MGIFREWIKKQKLESTSVPTPSNRSKVMIKTRSQVKKPVANRSDNLSPYGFS